MMGKARREIAYLAAVSFFLAFNYFILKSIKETLLVTAPDAGVEAIPFVKMWLLFPATLLFLGVFTSLASRISLRFAVSFMIAIFLSSYALFAFVLYPFKEALHLDSLADFMLLYIPGGWRALAAVVRYWSYSFFYVTAECWCTMIYSVVFWGYANAAIRYSDAKIYYPYLTLAGTTSALIAGPLTMFLTSDYFHQLVLSGHEQLQDPWQASLYGLITVVLANGVLALWCFWKGCPEAIEDSPAKTLAEPPLRTAFINVFKSKYLLALAGMCLTYNLVINMTDVVWKNEVVKLYPDPSHYSSYLGYIMIYTGIVSTLLTIFVTRPALEKYGWTKTALLTPMIALATGGLFFYAIFGAFPLEWIAFLGSLHICLSSAGKYTLFEPTKEMAFIPLPNSSKLYGKAVIDGMGSRLGKTSSSMIYQSMLVIFPTISACTPYVGGLLVLVILGCFICIFSLGRVLNGKAVSD
jgi:ATP:ADP antiporter, AAA family